MCVYLNTVCVCVKCYYLKLNPMTESQFGS